eukprot:UN04915
MSLSSILGFGNLERVESSSNFKPQDVTKKEISHLGVWTVSSAKDEMGVDNLLDNLMHTYWQSTVVQYGKQNLFGQQRMTHKKRIKYRIQLR